MAKKPHVKGSNFATVLLRLPANQAIKTSATWRKRIGFIEQYGTLQDVLVMPSYSRTTGELTSSGYIGMIFRCPLIDDAAFTQLLSTMQTTSERYQYRIEVYYRHGFRVGYASNGVAMASRSSSRLRYRQLQSDGTIERQSFLAFVYGTVPIGERTRENGTKETLYGSIVERDLPNYVSTFQDYCLRVMGTKLPSNWKTSASEWHSLLKTWEHYIELHTRIIDDAIADCVQRDDYGTQFTVWRLRQAKLYEWIERENSRKEAKQDAKEFAELISELRDKQDDNQVNELLGKKKLRENIPVAEMLKGKRGPKREAKRMAKIGLIPVFADGKRERKLLYDIPNYHCYLPSDYVGVMTCG